MIIIALLKGVPARTTRVVTVSGVLKREEMDIVMNPHDVKAIEAADYVKRRAGGKIVALTMGPDVKLAPIMNGLYDSQVEGVDETVILSDRRMAGADTLATAYSVSLGVKNILDTNKNAVDQLISLIESGAEKNILFAKAKELYDANLIPNKIFSSLPPMKQTIMSEYFSGRLSKNDALFRLQKFRDSLANFLIVTGVKTTDGETGSVGPQTAEALSDLFGFLVPHITYVHDFEVEPTNNIVLAERKISRTIQILEARLPLLLTISPDYRSRVAPAGFKKEVRENNYKGKIRQIVKWDATVIGADPRRIGLPGSPTLVGPGVDIGRPLSQKILGRTLIFRGKVEPLSWDGRAYGPFQRGDRVEGLPDDLQRDLMERGLIQAFGYQDLLTELFGDLNASR